LRLKTQIALVILVALAVGRILVGYFENSQAFDEPAHVAAGMGWLDRGTYLVDPLHPPLSRIAIAIPLYLAGLRTPEASAQLSGGFSYWVMGNSILYGGGHYWRNLSLARLGILPFFLAGAWLVFWWARREYGRGAGIFAVFFFTTLPGILTFAGVAYTDFPAAIAQTALILAFTCWLGNPTRTATIWLGIAAGLAFLAKFTILIFFPAAAFGIVVLWATQPRTEPFFRTGRFRFLAKVPLVLLLAAIIIWAGYRFSFKPVVEGMQFSRTSPPSFQHLPGPARGFAREMVAHDFRVPAPELMLGIAQAYVVSHAETPSYVLGKERHGGTWYFFPLGLFFKNPLPFLVTVAMGMFVIFGGANWTKKAPGVAALCILAASMTQRYNAGQRHVLVLYPLLAIVAGAGAALLWESRKIWLRALMIALLLWQAVESARAGFDPMAYFNELAGANPSRVLVTGCDLDCGQDVARLGVALRKRNVDKVHVALWTTAELDKMGLAPQVEVLQPQERATGWVAVGVRSLIMGDVGHVTYPAGSLDWLQDYRPVAKVGSTILLYCVPGAGTSANDVCSDRN
jgi:hypothetical protein